MGKKLDWRKNKTDEEIIEVGKNYYEGAERDLKAFHNIRSPFQNLTDEEYYKEGKKVLLEEALNEKAIFEKFGLEYPMPKEIEDLVKWADNVALATEARDLMAPPPQPWNLPEKPDNKIVVPMTQQEAKAKFLETFYGLFE